jgi:hypothetical protein
MVYNIQNYWVFGLCPSSGIPKNREHNFSETESVPVSETLCSLILRTTDRVQESSNFERSELCNNETIRRLSSPALCCCISRLSLAELCYCVNVKHPSRAFKFVS